MEKGAVNAVTSRRKKLWEIDSYHCSIIGSCLSRADLRKIARRKEFGLSAELSDYLLHTALVNLAARKGAESRALHKILDRKFNQALNLFAKVKSEPDVRDLWRQCLAKGSLAGPYWALLTHPATSSVLAGEAHGEIHMIEHDFVSVYQRRTGQLEDLRAKVALQEESLAAEKNKFRDIKQTLHVERREHSQMLQNYDRLQREHESLRQQVLKLEARPLAYDRLVDKEQLERLQQDNASLCGQVDQLTDQLVEARELVKLAEMNIHELARANERLLDEKQLLAQEVGSLEMPLLGKLFDAGSCEHCADQNTESCPGPGLCGKTVLYVGGLHKMVPHYKQLVEKYGGVFVHHDGGRESSRAMLPKLLSGADAVMCPVDCVSHDACKNVKKICKKYQKPFVMMRSSGLSSLAKGLSEIMVVQ